MKKISLLLAPLIIITPALDAMWNPFAARWAYDRRWHRVYRAPIEDLIDDYPEESLIILGVGAGYYGTNVYYNRKLFPQSGWKSHLFTPFKDFYRGSLSLGKKSISYPWQGIKQGTNACISGVKGAARGIKNGIAATGSSIKNISKRAVSNTVAGIKNSGSFCFSHKGKIGGACAVGALIAGGLWASQEYFCDICQENKYQPYFTTLSCGHRYCTDCLNGQVDYGLRSKSTDSLKCPDPECKRPFTNKIIRKIVGFFSNKRTQFQELADQKYLISLPNSQHCPTPNCQYIMEDRGENPHSVDCPQCHAQYCSHCLLNHTENVSCRQARDEQLSAADKESEKLIHATSTKCPQCGTNIQKNGGCNHMTCQKCRYEFCWLCLAPRRDYNGHACNPIGLLRRPGIALSDQQLIG